LFFYIVVTKALGPQDFCDNYKPRTSGSSSIADPGQTSSPRYTSDEKTMHKFMLNKIGKEEKKRGEKRERRKYYQNTRIR